MTPILYAPTETDFRGNGIGALRDAISCSVIWELNGQYEMTMKYPLSGIRYSEIAMRSVIMAQPATGVAPQPFRVYHITKPASGVITNHARHIAYDLMGVPVSPFHAGSAALAMQALHDHAVTSSPFQFWTDKSTTGTIHTDAPCAAWSLMGGAAGSILDVYGGEYEFDRFTVKLHNRIGADRGAQIRYGKNLISLEQEESCAGCYTGVYPYWLSTMDDAVERVELPEKIVKAEGNFDHERVYILDLSQEWQEKPSVDQLRTRAQRYIRQNNIGVPAVTLTVEFAALDQTEEYRDAAPLERVSWGDTVAVYFDRLGVQASARVVATDYNPLTERFEKVTLGRVRSDIAKTIVNQQHQIDRAPTTTDLEQARIAATAWLTNGKGYKLERRDDNGNTIDTLYMDKPDINQAVNVLRIGQSGIGFSHNGVNGPYASAWTIDGRFNADFITTGSFSASLITTGSLQADLIKLLGRFAVYNGTTLGGSIGYQPGATPDGATNGIGLKNPAGDCYCVVTDGGVAVKAGEVSAFVAKDGSAWLSAPRIVFNGNMVVNGEITAWKLTQTGKEG